MTPAVVNGLDLLILSIGILILAALLFSGLVFQGKRWAEEEAEERAEQAELSGSLEQFRAEQAEKVTRARFRHTTRHTRRI